MGRVSPNPTVPTGTYSSRLGSARSTGTAQPSALTTYVHSSGNVSWTTLALSTWGISLDTTTRNGFADCPKTEPECSCLLPASPAGNAELPAVTPLLSR